MDFTVQNTEDAEKRKNFFPILEEVRGQNKQNNKINEIKKFNFDQGISHSAKMHRKKGEKTTNHWKIEGLM